MPVHHIPSYLSIMSERSTGRHPDAARYEIRIKGHLNSRWAAWFEDERV